MLTLKLINEETERVIRGLEKKHFQGAAEAIAAVQATDKKRREAQQQLDNVLAESKKKAAEIGALMKQGLCDDADKAKAAVAELKEKAKELEATMDEAQRQLTEQLCQIPNIPYDEVPEGVGAEDNIVVKSNLRECQPGPNSPNSCTNSSRLPELVTHSRASLIFPRIPCSSTVSR